jgi:hypothetical protein
MKREDEYRQLANDVLRRASKKQSAQLRAISRGFGQSLRVKSDRQFISRVREQAMVDWGCVA